MPLRQTEFVPDNFYHIYNRGNEKKIIFHDRQDYFYFLKKIKQYKKLSQVKIICYILMPNHFHFILSEPEEDLNAGRLTTESDAFKSNRLREPLKAPGASISRFMYLLQMSYAQYFNQKYNSSGHVFQGRFQSILINRDDYLEFLSCYIHLNAFTAGLVKLSSLWQFSSLPDYLFLRNGSIPDKEFLPVGEEYQHLLDDYLELKKERENAIRDLIIEVV
ncbi:MAG: transposase [Chlamydiae bacterium]|nr:MAG: transposase [Chlamydiota bacterium]